MASNPKMEYPVLRVIFQKNSAMAILGLKEMERNFIGKMQNKVWYYKNWVGRHASFPPK